MCSLFQKEQNLSDFSPKIKEFERNTSTGVYSIPCDDCSPCYIGETKQVLTMRFSEHQQIAAIKNNIQLLLISQK